MFKGEAEICTEISHSEVSYRNKVTDTTEYDYVFYNTSGKDIRLFIILEFISV